MSTPVIASFIGGTAVAHGVPGLPLVRPQDGTLIGTILEASEARIVATVEAARAAIAADPRAGATALAAY